MDGSYTVRVRYVCEDGDGNDEARYHQQIAGILTAAGYSTEIYTGPVSGHVGVHVNKLEAPTAEDWEALLRISDGTVTLGCEDVQGIPTALYWDLLASELISSGRKEPRSDVSTVMLTDAGAALLFARNSAAPAAVPLEEATAPEPHPPTPTEPTTA